VETPTWHHIPFLHSVSRFSSQLSFLCLHTHSRPNPDNGRLTIAVALSRFLYLCLADKANTLLCCQDYTVKHSKWCIVESIQVLNNYANFSEYTAY